MNSIITKHCAYAAYALYGDTVFESQPSLKTDKGVKSSVHVERIIIKKLLRMKKHKINKDIILFHTFSVENKKTIFVQNNIGIASCFMCNKCINYIKKQYPWAILLKWKTFDKSGKLISAIKSNAPSSYCDNHN